LSTISVSCGDNPCYLPICGNKTKNESITRIENEIDMKFGDRENLALFNSHVKDIID
jgi:hypothetical protein